MKRFNLLVVVLISIVCIYSNVYAQTSSIKMNEIYSRGIPTDPDWIELYNLSNIPVNIGGYKIYDVGGQGGTKPKMEFPANTIIPAKGFYVVVTDIATTVNPAGFGLSSGGEKVWLEDKSGTIIDTITFAAMTETQSYGRYLDGGGWMLLNRRTKGFPNTVVLMNEIYSRGIATDPDWIEIANLADSAIDISGYKIYDVGGQGGTKPKMEFPANSIIAAKGFLAIVTDIATTTNPAGFGLSSGGEKVWLEDKAGIIIDSITFPSMTETQTYGRYPDGLAWNLLNKLTKGATNNTATDIKPVDRTPDDFRLEQNYPNPFNPSTTINFNLPKDGFVKIVIYDLNGKAVKTLVDKMMKSGNFTIVWYANSDINIPLSSGKYFYTISLDNKVLATKSMIYLK